MPKKTRSPSLQELFAGQAAHNRGSSTTRCNLARRASMAVPAFALPGELLAPSASHAAGPGTHVQNSHLYASLAGPVTSTPGGKKALPILSIGSSALSPSANAVIPAVGNVVLGRITRTNPRQASLDILALGAAGTQVLHEPFQALIRQQDIRATEIDKVKVAESFRVGDVVRGTVISLGDERNYYVSTARNEFGVVLATSEAGGQMVPVSWREMRDLTTGLAEARKVAKVV